MKKRAGLAITTIAIEEVVQVDQIIQDHAIVEEPRMRERFASSWPLRGILL